ncbi:MAG: hypothetical protein M0P91_13695 [Sulfuricurvum sp.]|jgi:outer membrane biosynthesis protein TonB|uniref:hypothetical protein n=1 Tax=Sulfuricurvum sp. TaxID=2025608 RepID=UPI0025DFED01|nr:hypothetical protein [Sulfuricurvum sp.]MCK9374230.1 hypothetical protein [Sulfuricurvum sp.]
MKRTKSFSLYAFIIAFSVHFIALLLLIILNLFVPQSPEKPEPPKEERFRLSLKENPQAHKEAVEKNKLPEVLKERPIPRGEQLIKPSAAAAQSEPIPLRPQPLPEPIPEKSEAVAEPKKAFLPHVAKTVATIEKTPLKKEPGLYDILSKADPSAQNVMSKPSSTRVGDSIQRLYGDKFNDLSAGEQKYIIDNQETMRRITQGVLDRYGHSKIPDSVRIKDTNMIEFYLHPDGSISDLHFLKNSQLSLLDDTTKETIELAYARYPRPEQKTLIRYRVLYDLTGY